MQIPELTARQPVVFCGLPSYNGENPVAQTLDLFRQQQNCRMLIRPFKFSLLTYAFNSLWAEAINGRRTHGVTHFLLMHSDIVPAEGQNWLDLMIREMDAVGADVLSVVAPLKTTQGLTTTGILAGEPYHPWLVKRLSMKEIFGMPETFTHEKLVVNTGMMLVDIRKDWVTRICFHVKDDMQMMPDGRLEPLVFPEDWNFSVEARALGARIFATRKVKMTHMGIFGFPNDAPWGDGSMDQIEGKLLNANARSTLATKSNV